MPSRPTSNPTQFIQGAPVIAVPDTQATAAYYRDKLNFTWDYDSTQYCVVWRDNSALHFTQGTNVPTGISLFQWVIDVDAYYAEISGLVPGITNAPMDRDYGIRDFSILDPNGIAVTFGQDI